MPAYTPEGDMANWPQDQQALAGLTPELLPAVDMTKAERMVCAKAWSWEMYGQGGWTQEREEEG